ncbi:MAG: hypothetical protein V8Q79_03225 [Christensenellales bacterium]
MGQRADGCRIRMDARFSVMAISTCKDTLFSACVLVMMLQHGGDD